MHICVIEDDILYYKSIVGSFPDEISYNLNFSSQARDNFIIVSWADTSCPPASMDLVLRICDDYLLDNVWATLIPLSGLTSPELPGSSPNISPNFAPVPVSSTWSQIVSHLPHSFHQNSSLYTTAAKSPSFARVSAWPRDYIPRQLISLCVITLVGIHVLYFVFAWLSYKFIFNHEMMKHPRFLKNQVKLEIQTSLSAFPAMMLLTLPWFQAEVMGYSKVYDGLDKYGYFYLFASVPLCVFLSHSPIPQTDPFSQLPALH